MVPLLIVTLLPTEFTMSYQLACDLQSQQLIMIAANQPYTFAELAAKLRKEEHAKGFDTRKHLRAIS